MIKESTKKSKEGQMKKIDVIRKHWGKMSYAEIAKLCGSTPEAVRKCGRNDGLPPYRLNAQNRELTPEQELERDITIRSSQKREKSKDTKLKFALDKIELLTKQVEVLQSTADIETEVISTRSSSRNGATPVVVLSDWHWWEVVNSNQVDGLNEFNPQVAEARATLLFQNIVKLVKFTQSGSDISEMVLALLGDFISGNIHEELLEGNAGLVIDEMMSVQNAIASGIEYLLKETNLSFVIPCHSGNHARITQKTHIATEAGNSLEYLMYHNLANHFKNEKRVRFLIPRGYLSYVDVSGFIIRFHHGHAIKYGGGIGGIFISAFKAISQWDKAKRADLDVFGHFHQIKDGGKFISNGSLVGYNDYALRIKADFEKPKQVFFLVDHARKEKTTTCPIFLT